MFFVLELSQIRNLLPHLFADVLDDEVVHSDVLLGVQTPAMDGRSVELDQFLPFLELVETDGHVCIAAQGLLLEVDIVDESAVVGAVAARSGCASGTR